MCGAEREKRPSCAAVSAECNDSNREGGGAAVTEGIEPFREQGLLYGNASCGEAGVAAVFERRQSSRPHLLCSFFATWSLRQTVVGPVFRR